MAGFCF
ncbi:hypothetical protein YPPY10_4929, partial [Yersinia pestis PY-10]